MKPKIINRQIRLDPFTKLKHPLMLRFQQKNEPGDTGYFDVHGDFAAGQHRDSMSIMRSIGERLG